MFGQHSVNESYFNFVFYSISLFLKEVNSLENRLVAGIDVGLKKSHVAVLEGRRIVYIGDFEDFIRKGYDISAAGIDAPLSFPVEGSLRDCERELLKMGIRLFPSGAKFFRKIAERGIEIAEMLENRGVEVFEVYPYATRLILNIAPKAKKFRKEGRIQLISGLKRYVGNVNTGLSHDEIDAVLSALTVALFCEGKARLVCGKDGCILIPVGITTL